MVFLLVGQVFNVDAHLILKSDVLSDVLFQFLDHLLIH